jgi:hypothetical protein
MARDVDREAIGLAKELLTACWTYLDGGTAQDAVIYRDALMRARDATIALDVLDRVAKISVAAMMLWASAEGTEYQEVLADMFARIDAADPGGRGDA